MRANSSLRLHIKLLLRPCFLTYSACASGSALGEPLASGLCVFGRTGKTPAQPILNRNRVKKGRHSARAKAAVPASGDACEQKRQCRTGIDPGPARERQEARDAAEDPEQLCVSGRSQRKPDADQP